MIPRSNIIVSQEKSKAFIAFMKCNAKDRAFWQAIKEGASQHVDKEKLDNLFQEQDIPNHTN